MLDPEDLRQISKLLEASEKRTQKNMQEAISASEERMIKRMDERLKATEARWDKRLEKRITHSESMLLDEMERYDQKNEQRFQKIERKIEGLKEIYRIAKLESGNFEIFSHTVQDHDRRLTALEAKMA